MAWDQKIAELKHQLWHQSRESCRNQTEVDLREDRCAEIRRGLVALGAEPVGERLDHARWPRSGVK
jgi:hypothetical protein